MKKLMLIGALLLGGCRAVDSAADCQHVCERYRDCFDAEYGVDSCAERCRTSANTDTEYYRKVDSCDACIDARACATAVFGCSTHCAAVVP